jgi:hypothetical protein
MGAWRDLHVSIQRSANAELDHETEVEGLCAEVEQLRAALETRDAIGQAKGMIRLLIEVDSDSAFEMLCKVSQDTNRRLHDLAVLFADCATSGTQLPPDVNLSWRRRTCALEPADPTGP